MFELLIFLFVISPFIAITMILCLISANRNKKELQKENEELKKYLSFYKRKYGKLDEKEIVEIKNEIKNAENNFRKDEQIIKKEVYEYKSENNIHKEEENNKSIALSKIIKDYIDKNNISQGNLFFALGVVFISIAGIVFATTTWSVIPNIYKILIIFIVSIILNFLSNIANKKFKLFKTSLTLYVLFCIITSLIPLSMGYFHMLGEYLSISGVGKFLLYAISLLVFIVLFLIYAIKNKLKKVTTYLLYAVNIEILLLTLNFTKRFDLIMCVLSLYNLILMIVANVFKEKRFLISTKEVKEVSNNTLLLLSILSITNMSSGILMTLLSIYFAILYMNNNIKVEHKKFDFYKYIIASVFLIISCLRFNVGYDFLWTTEYLTFITIVLSILLLCFDKLKSSSFIYMFYIMVGALIISIGRDFNFETITVPYLISILSNLIAVIILCIKSKVKIFKYIKTIYCIFLIVSICKYLYNTYSISLFYVSICMNLLLISAYIISNAVNLKLFKDKFADVFTNITYSGLVFISVIATVTHLKTYDTFEKRIIIYSILLLFQVFINKFNQKIYKKSLVSRVNIIEDTVLFLVNCLVIKINPIACVINFSSIFYDYIKLKNNEGKKIYEYILMFSYLIYVNLLAYFILPEYRIIVLLIFIAIYFVLLNIINNIKIKQIDLKMVDITVIINLISIYLIELMFYNREFINMIFILIVFNILLIYLYAFRNNNYKKVIEAVIQLTILKLLFWCEKENNYYTFWLFYGFVFSSTFFWYYILLMIISAMRIYIGIGENKNAVNDKEYFVNEIRNCIFGITKYSMPTAIVICMFRLIFRDGYYYSSYFSYNLYILTIFLAIYLISILIKLKIKNDKYESKNFKALIICQLFTMQLLFIDLINNNLLRISKYFKFNFMFFDILFFLVIINATLLLLYRSFIYKFISNRTLNNNIISDNLLTFDKALFNVRKVYTKVIKTIVIFGGLLVVLYIMNYVYFINGSNYIKISSLGEVPQIILVFEYIILAIMLNIVIVKESYNKIVKVLIYFIPYICLNLFNFFMQWDYENASSYYNFKLISVVVIFIIYYILTFVIKNKKFKIEFKNINIDISYFAIVNISMIIYFNKCMYSFSHLMLLKYIVMIDWFFACLFILQFIGLNKKFNKIIYSLSLLCLTATLLSQNIINLLNYKEEYYLLILTFVIYILDKCIWKFKEKISSKIWIIYHILSFLIIFSKVLINNLIINTILFGIVMVVLLFISFIIKKYYHFIITTIFMIITAIYVTRNFWLNIAWWMYLLIVGILLIVFATKNEQLKKENKNFIKEINNKIRKYLNRH